MTISSTSDTAITVEKKLSVSQKLCRKLVFTQFEKLSYGKLTVLEAGKTYEFGDLSSSLQADLTILDPQVYVILVTKGSIGAAQAFIEQLWTSTELTHVIRIFAKAQKSLDQLESRFAWLSYAKYRWHHWRNNNSVKNAKQNILAHYDLGNALYQRFLDSEMMYSSAIYPDQQASLGDAQLFKLKTICDKLQLSADDHLLEIGTGWGGLAIYAAKHYGCKVTTTTISNEQYDYAKARIEAEGLSEQITLLKQDYRLLTGQYDKLVSIEMIEAVGYQYLTTFFKQCNSLLKPQGKMLLQSITIADQRFAHYLGNVDFIQRYIFPGGFLPCVNELAKQFANNTNMTIEHLQDIGLDYAKTLADWRENFLKSWHELTEFGFDETFKRLWLYYLGYCEGAFLERSTSTVQVLARKA